MSTAVNLIPRSRRAQRRRRICQRRWAAVGAAYTLAVVAALPVCRSVWAGSGLGGHDPVRVLDDQLHQLEQQIIDLGPTVQQEEQRLKAHQTILIKPDWSMLLAVLSESLGDRVVLERCRVRIPALNDQSATLGDEADETTRVVLEGLGRSQHDVTGFVLRLEKTGVFSSVELVQTDRRWLVSQPAVRFNVVCDLGQPEQTEP